MSRFYCNFVSVCRGVCQCVRGCVEGVSRVYHGLFGCVSGRDLAINVICEYLIYNMYFYLL